MANFCAFFLTDDDLKLTESKLDFGVFSSEMRI